MIKKSIFSRIARIAVMLLLFLIAGKCAEASIISGRVIDERNFPVTNVKVIVNGKETSTDKLGKFRMIDVIYPYTVVIAERMSSSAVVYRGLSTDTPELTFFGAPDNSNADSAVIKFSFPSVPEGSSATVKFISTETAYCEDREILSGETSGKLTIYWPVSKTSVSGNLVMIQKNAKSYESFIQKSVTLYRRSVPFQISVTGKSASTITTSGLTVYFPAKDVSARNYSVFADFFAYSRNSEMLLAEGQDNSAGGNNIIPAKLPVSYRVKVSGYAEYKNGSGFVSSYYSRPGSTVSIDAEVPPDIISPSDKLVGANGSTEFSYSIGSGTGVYVIHFRSFYPEMSFYVVTDEKKANLEYLSRDEFKRAGSIEFRWYVRKYLTYFSINDFVKRQEFANDIGYKAILYSAERTFKTGFY